MCKNKVHNMDKMNTENILEKFKKQLEIDKQNENYDLPSNTSLKYSDKEMDEYKKTLDSLRKSDQEVLDNYNKFHEAFKPLTEKEMENDGLTKVEEVTFKVKRAYCPNCGKEIVSKMPTMFNPYTLEKIARYDCSCGARFNLEYAYPRFVILDENGNEIKCFFE